MRDVLAVDLIEAREALAEHVPAVIAPIARVGRLRERAASPHCHARRGGHCDCDSEEAARNGDRTPGGAAGLVVHGRELSMTGRACGESRLTRAPQNRELVWLIDI